MAATERVDYYKDYIDLQKQYGGQYVAIYKGLVVAHAKAFDNVCKSIEDKIGDENLLIGYVEHYDAACIY